MQSTDNMSINMQYILMLFKKKVNANSLGEINVHKSTVEPQIQHFANFTPCEELVAKRHFWKM